MERNKKNANKCMYLSKDIGAVLIVLETLGVYKVNTFT